MTARTMSENRRAFLALLGETYPRAGDRAICFEDNHRGIDAEFSDDLSRTVEVTRVSETGATIWTRFICPVGQRRFGVGLPLHRWIRIADGYYRAMHKRPLPGNLSFPWVK